MRTRLRGAKGLVAVFFCVLMSATFASCYDYEEHETVKPDISVEVDGTWGAIRVYDQDGNLLYTVTASGDTIWNNGKEGGDGR